MADLVIYSYGGGEVLRSIFNAVAMVFHAGFMQSFIYGALLVFCCFKLIRAILTGGGVFNCIVISCFKLCAVYFMIDPRMVTTANIKDIFSEKPYRVDNVPFILAYPASVINNFFYDVTKYFDTAFQSIGGNYMAYHKYGLTFGASVIGDFKKITYKNKDLMQNFNAFYDRCVIRDLRVGKYTAEDLRASEDIWKTIEDASSTLFSADYVENKRVVIKSCREIASSLKSIYSIEPTGMIKYLQNKGIFTADYNSVSSLLEGVLSQHTKTTGVEQLKQLFVINAIRGYELSHLAGKTEQENKILGFVSAEMLRRALPMAHASLQALFYSAFLFFLLFMAFKNDISGYLFTFFSLLIWIELWAPLLSICNLIITTFAGSSLNGINNLTINAFIDLIDVQSDYASIGAAVALGLVPSFAFAIIRGGEYAITGFASSIVQASKGGAHSAVAEAVSGNYSYDNQNFSNTSANKYDTTGSFFAGSFKSQEGQGAINTTFTSGHTMNQQGEGINEDSSDVRVSADTTATEAASRVATYREEYAQQESKTIQHASDMVSEMRKALNSGESFELSDGSIINKETARAKDMNKMLNKENENNASRGASAGFQGGFGTGGIKLGADVGMNVQSSNQIKIAEGIQNYDNLSNSERVSLAREIRENVHFTKEQGTSLAASERFGESYEKQESTRKALDIAEESSKTVSQQFSYGGSEYAGLVAWMSDQQDPNSIYKDGKMGKRAAINHINNQDEVFKKLTAQYQATKYSQNSVGGASSFDSMQKQINNSAPKDFTRAKEPAELQGVGDHVSNIEKSLQAEEKQQRGRALNDIEKGKQEQSIGHQEAKKAQERGAFRELAKEEVKNVKNFIKKIF